MASIGPNELFFLLQGLKWTLALTIIGFIGGGIFGLCVALARVADSPAIQRASTAYIAIFQGTPLLMQLFVVYYGVALAGLNVDAWIAVAIAFTLHASAFLGEIWRGGIQAVPKGQTEAANALGLHRAQIFRHIILKPALRAVYPSLTSQFIMLTLTTSVCTSIAAYELTSVAQKIEADTFRSFEVYFSITLLYLVISSLMMGIFSLISRASFSYPVK